MKLSEITKNDVTVNVDGSAIKRIREQQSLTQLYVAKVVGVTTDTISRWENNRYPTIKRVNAQKLAEALEVDIEQLLRAADAQVEQVEQTAQGGKRRNLKVWITVATVVVLAVLGGVWLWLAQPSHVVAERLLPSYASPGMVIPVQISLHGAEARGVVRETLPTGWEFIGAVPAPASFDQEKGLLRWIVQISDTPVNIYYLVKVATDSVLNSMPSFDGGVVVRNTADSAREELIGVNQLVIAHIHWADLNGDGLIDDDEMLEAASLSEDMPSLPLDLDSVEDLWIEEYYHWSDKLNNFIPNNAAVD
ncbi:MAG: helix-turn-helix transcriptional regulator [Desulfuromonas sp.]|nr:helix-turn-helix transcriptional regulator [Desulfuromonas sp.]